MTSQGRVRCCVMATASTVLGDVSVILAGRVRSVTFHTRTAPTPRVVATVGVLKAPASVLQDSEESTASMVTTPRLAPFSVFRPCLLVCKQNIPKFRLFLRTVHDDIVFCLRCLIFSTEVNVSVTYRCCDKCISVVCQRTPWFVFLVILFVYSCIQTTYFRRRSNNTTFRRLSALLAS